MCGLHEVQSSGQGQGVDVAMTDGAAHLMAMMYSLKHNQMWSEFRGSNLLDGGAHFYGTFECADGEWVAIGSIEPQFYALLLEKAGVDDDRFKQQMDATNWPALKNALAQIFRSRTRGSVVHPHGRFGCMFCASPVHDRGAWSLPQHGAADVR